MRRPTLVFLAITSLAGSVYGHDIPNARVDRSIQVTILPRRVQIDYEVSLAELTLTQDLRSLIGTLPSGDRGDWFARYGLETGPLNAKGLLVTAEGQRLGLRVLGYDLAVEEHPQYRFHFEAPLPIRGRLRVQDTNFEASEGTSRLAVRGREGMVVRGDDLPGDVALITPRPIWQLSDDEEKRTKQVEVSFEGPNVAAPPALIAPARDRVVAPGRPARIERLTKLMDRSPGVSWIGLALIAFALGAAHSVQPGHGKTLVATVVVEDGTLARGIVLALVTTLTHTASVVVVAAGLWLTRSSRYDAIDAALARGAGFTIAAIGLWRLGRHLAGYGEHDRALLPSFNRGARGLVGLGVAGGLVPCWDAVGLIVLAEAIGRLALGLGLLVAFGLGMTVTLIVVGFVTSRLRRFVRDAAGEGRWERRLGIAGSLVLSAIGLYLLGSR